MEISKTQLNDLHQNLNILYHDIKCLRQHLQKLIKIEEGYRCIYNKKVIKNDYPIEFPPSIEVIQNIDFNEPREFIGIYCWCVHGIWKSGFYKIGQSGGKGDKDKGGICQRILKETEETSNPGKIDVQFILECNKPSTLEQIAKDLIKSYKGLNDEVSSGKEIYYIEDINKFKKDLLLRASENGLIVKEIPSKDFLSSPSLFVKRLNTNNVGNLISYKIVPGKKMEDSGHHCTDYKKCQYKHRQWLISNLGNKNKLIDILMPLKSTYSIRKGLSLKKIKKCGNLEDGGVYNKKDFEYDLKYGYLKLIPPLELDKSELELNAKKWRDEYD